MWKILVAFAIFAALALFILSKGGDIDMGGEKHDVSSHSEPAAPASATALAPAEAASASASAASN